MRYVCTFDVTHVVEVIVEADDEMSAWKNAEERVDDMSGTPTLFDVAVSSRVELSSIEEKQ